MKKRLIIFLYAFIGCICFASFAFAEIHCSCNLKKCTCFVQRGDKGIAVEGMIDLLYNAGYLDTERGSAFDGEVYDAVCLFQYDHGLEASGMMDDNTLTMLIWGVYADEMEESSEVFVPTDGGKKRHRKPTCSGMHDPRVMSSLNAQALGIDACKRCKPE